MQILDKIKDLKAKLRSEDREIVEGWERKWLEADEWEQLANHKSVKLVLDKIEEQVNQIEINLKGNRSMTDRERLESFAKIDCFNWLKSLFSQPSKNKQTIENFINENLYE
jgi:hypothetical protein